MSEETTEAAESAETAQGAVESETSAPWGDDFSAEKAWNTIQTQRESEKELKERLRQAEQVWEDDQALRERLQAKGFEFADDADEDDDDFGDDDDGPQFLTKQEYEERERQRQVADSNRQFASDLKELTSERELSKYGKDLISAKYERGEFKNASELKTALTEWFEWEDSLKETGLRSRPKPPTPPTAPGAGRAGEQEFDRRNASAAQRKAQREARIAAAVEAAQQP